MTFLILVLSLALVPTHAEASSPEPGEAEVLTLDQALALARKGSAALVAAELQIRRAEHELAASRTRRLPTLDVQGQGFQLLTPVEVTFPAGALGSFPATGPIPARDTVIESSQEPSARFSATLAQPLSQLYKIGLGVKAGRLSRDLEREQLRAQSAAVAHDVRQLYYGLLQTRSAREAARDQVKALRQMDEDVGRYVSVEAALPEEGLEVKAQLASAEYRLVRLDNELATMKEQLNVLFGRDPRTPFEVTPLSEDPGSVLDLETARTRAAERRPELAKARLQVELADTDRRSKKAEFIPEVSLALSYDSFFNVQLLPRNLAQLAVQVKWQPFDWGRRRKELASKTLAVDQATRAERDQRNRVLVDVDRAFRQVEEAKALVAVRRIANEAAQEKLRVALLRQQQQSVLLRDVLQAQAAAADARAQYDQAQLALWQARADLGRAVGEDE